LQGKTKALKYQAITKMKKLKCLDVKAIMLVRKVKALMLSCNTLTHFTSLTFTKVTLPALP
jgi:hypothetical protein